MTDKLRAAQQALYAMAMLIDPEKLEPWQIELYDKTTNALSTALAEQPAEQRSSGWQHPETAPLDGSHFLARTRTGGGSVIREAYFSGQRDHTGEPIFCVPITKMLCIVHEWMPIPDTTAPQPAKREPLTQQEVVDGFCKTPHQVQYVAVFDAGVRFAERAHGIGGGV